MDQSCEDVKNMMFMFKNIDRQVTQNFEKCTGISLTRYEILYTLLNSGQLFTNRITEEVEDRSSCNYKTFKNS